MKAVNDGPILFGLMVAVLFALTIAVPARAQTTPSDCQATVDALRTATVQVTTFTNERDQTGLIGKLGSATTKLEQGKVTDAIKALTDFRVKVDTLRTQGKIAPAHAETLIVGANAATACLQQLVD
jgi:hypothetical protein